MKLKQLVCKHDYVSIASHRSVSEDLWKCHKCDQLLVRHWGIDVCYKAELKDLDLDKWDTTRRY